MNNNKNIYGSMNPLNDNTMKSRQAKEDAFVAKLTADGHKCIKILESYPMQVWWCHQKKCSHLDNR